MFVSNEQKALYITVYAKLRTSWRIVKLSQFPLARASGNGRRKTRIPSFQRVDLLMNKLKKSPKCARLRCILSRRVESCEMRRSTDVDFCMEHLIWKGDVCFI